MLIKHIKSKLSRAFYADKTTYLILNYLKVETDSSKRIATTTNILNKLTDTLENATVYIAFI
jgi:hypothetical protein